MRKGIFGLKEQLVWLTTSSSFFTQFYFSFADFSSKFVNVLKKKKKHKTLHH